MTNEVVNRLIKRCVIVSCGLCMALSATAWIPVAAEIVDLPIHSAAIAGDYDDGPGH